MMDQEKFDRVISLRAQSALGCVRVAASGWADAVTQMAVHGHIRDNGDMSQEMSNWIMEVLVAGSVQQLGSAMGDSRDGMIDAIHALGQLAPTWGRFVQQGLPTYKLSYDAVDECEDGELGDVVPVLTLALAFEHQTCFIGWDLDQAPSVLAGDPDTDDTYCECIDGVFVSRREDGLLLQFTTRRDDGGALFAPGPWAEISFTEPECSLRDAVRSVTEVNEPHRGSKKKAPNSARLTEGTLLARVLSDRIAGALLAIPTARTGAALVASTPDLKESDPAPEQPDQATSLQLLDRGVVPYRQIDDVPVLEPAECPLSAYHLQRSLAAYAYAIQLAKQSIEDFGDEELDEHFAREIVRLLADPLVGDALIEVMRKDTSSIVGTVRLLSLLDDMDYEVAMDSLVGENFDEAAAATERINESIDALVKHWKGQAGEVLGRVAVSREGEGWSFRLQIHTVRPPMPCLWETLEFATADPVRLALVVGGAFETFIYEAKPRPTKPPLHPLFRYHPERFASTRKFPAAALQLKKSIDPRSSGQGQLITLMNHMMTAVSMEANERMGEYPLRQRRGERDLFGPVNASISLLMVWLAYHDAGKELFDLPAHMVESFRRTDVDDIPCSAVKLPHYAQYMYFGMQRDLELAPGWYVDGAYVTSGGGDWSVTVTACPDDPYAVLNWAHAPEPLLTLNLPGSGAATPLGQAVDESLARYLHELEAKRAKGDRDISETVEDIIPKGMVVLEKAATNADIAEENLNARLPAFREALRLVVNALCYLTAYPDDARRDYPDGAPARLVNQVRTMPKSAPNAKSKLEALGYRPVTFCGPRFEAEYAKSNTQGSTGPRWVRGHWRNVAWGEKRLLRRLQWIMPYRTGSDQGEPPLGHLYLVT